MSAAVLTLLGLVGTAIITGLVTLIVQGRSKAERDAGVAKTLAESDHGVAAAAEMLVNAITRDYERLAAELESVRRDVASLHVQLVDVRADRDGLVEKLNVTRAELRVTKEENVVLRQRVDDLEALNKNRGDHS